MLVFASQPPTVRKPLQVRSTYVTGDRRLDHEELKEAIVKANNEYHGQNATSFEQVVKSIQ
jgi:hypothetical protein